MGSAPLLIVCPGEAVVLLSVAVISVDKSGNVIVVSLNVIVPDTVILFMVALSPSSP